MHITKNAVTILLLVAIGITLIPASSVYGDVSWSDIDTIYYNPAQEDEYNNDYLATAANELSTFLGNVGQTLAIETGSMPSNGAIYLLVDASKAELAGKNDEAFHIIVDDTGIHITGKTPLAVRHGAYYLLDECLGFRWFFTTDSWIVEPDVLPAVSTIVETVQEPVYLARQLVFGDAVVRNWNRFNRMWGADKYMFGEVYRSLLQSATGFYDMTAEEKRTLYLNDPSVFLPQDKWLGSGYPSYPWQLNPLNSTVQSWALTFANNSLANTIGVYDINNTLPYASVSVTPNDGTGWNPPYNDITVPPNDYQAITNAVYTLANVVAANISVTHPDKYVAVLGYTHYGGIPTFALEPNIIATPTTSYNYTPLTLIEQLEGLMNKGVELGIYDYPEVLVWYKDKPIRNWNCARNLQFFYDEYGVKYYNSEAYGTAWGAKGPMFYAISKYLWNPDRDLEEILLDFYSKAFGPARGVMQKYYETAGVYKTSGRVSEGNVALRFKLLDEAEKIVEGMDDIVERIHQLQYYERFVWKFWLTGVYGGAYSGLTGLDQAGLEDLYTFLTKIDSYYILNTEYFIDTTAAALVSRFPGTYPNTSTVEATLADSTPPTSGQTATWLTEALSYFDSYSGGDIYYDPFYLPITLDKTGNTTYPVTYPAANLYGSTYILPCEAGETVTIALKGDFQSKDVVWENPYELETDNITVGYLSDWTNIQFTANITGNWKLVIPVAGVHYVNIPDHKASQVISDGTDIWLSSVTDVSLNSYFYVPPRTESFRIGVTCPNGMTVTGTINGSDGSSQIINITEDTDFVFTSPAEGIWSINLPPQNHAYINLKIRGIYPLLWNDPEYLLVPEDPTPVGDANGDYTVNVVDMTRLAQMILLLEAATPGADVNWDSEVNVLDMTYIARIILGQN